MGCFWASKPVHVKVVIGTVLFVLSGSGLLFPQAASVMPANTQAASQSPGKATPANPPANPEQQHAIVTATPTITPTPTPDQDKAALEQKQGAAADQSKSNSNSSPPCSVNCDAVKAWWWTFTVVTGLLGVLVLISVFVLGRGGLTGRWSLADALSEESACQPATIKSRVDVILLASSSRLIAFMGLLGILSVVLGTGYAIIWNMFVRGAPPSGLTEVRAFMLGAATLFAPYLANQLRAAFDNPSTATASKPTPTATTKGLTTGGTSSTETPANSSAGTSGSAPSGAASQPQSSPSRPAPIGQLGAISTEEQKTPEQGGQP